MSTAGLSGPASAKSHRPGLAAAQQAARKRTPDPGAQTTRSPGGMLTGLPVRSLSVSPR
jgi:hypothetical protein